MRVLRISAALIAMAAWPTAEAYAHGAAELRQVMLPALGAYVECLNKRDDAIRTGDAARHYHSLILQRCSAIRNHASRDARTLLRHRFPEMTAQEIRAAVTNQVAEFEASYAPPITTSHLTHHR